MMERNEASDSGHCVGKQEGRRFLLVLQIAYVLLVLKYLTKKVRQPKQTDDDGIEDPEWILLATYSTGLLAFYTHEIVHRLRVVKKPEEKGEHVAPAKKENTALLGDDCPSSCTMRILLARYGTTQKDIDVTSKLQQFIQRETDGSYSLRIPKDLNLNRYFGKDPHRFRRKKLRFVALFPDGTPVAHFLKESRREDFHLKTTTRACSPFMSSASVGTSSKVATSEEDDEADPSNPVTDVSRKARGSRASLPTLTLTAPAVRAMYKKFSTLRTQLPFHELEVEDLMDACDDIAAMISLFGASMLSVRSSITDNLVKVRRSLAQREKSQDTRIGTVILKEVSNGTMKQEGSICLSSLWLKRSLDFMVLFIADVLLGKDAAKAAIMAYKRTLEPWQGWIVRAACKTGMRLVPKREAILRVLAAPETGSDDNEVALVKELDAMMEEFTAVVSAMDTFFTKHDLDFPEKC
eukprot:g5517.t1